MNNRIRHPQKVVCRRVFFDKSISYATMDTASTPLDGRESRLKKDDCPNSNVK